MSSENTAQTASANGTATLGSQPTAAVAGGPQLLPWEWAKADINNQARNWIFWMYRTKGLVERLLASVEEGDKPDIKFMMISCEKCSVTDKPIVVGFLISPIPRRSSLLVSKVPALKGAQFYHLKTGSNIVKAATYIRGGFTSKAYGISRPVGQMVLEKGVGPKIPIKEVKVEAEVPLEDIEPVELPDEAEDEELLKVFGGLAMPTQSVAVC